jgi:hypothetical protein
MFCCARFRLRAFSTLALLLPLAATWSGCGGEKQEVAPEDTRIGGLVTSLEDVAGDPKSFESLFAPGAAPKDSERPKYKQYTYQLKDTPRVSGDTATFTAVMSKDGSVVGEKEWTAVKVGDAWKLKDAPLP